MCQKTTPLNLESLAALASADQPQRLSLYQPTHLRHPENRQDRIRFRNLVREMEASLRQTYPTFEAQQLLRPFEELAQDNDLWDHTQDGLAVLIPRRRASDLILDAGGPSMIDRALSGTPRRAGCSVRDQASSTSSKRCRREIHRPGVIQAGSRRARISGGGGNGRRSRAGTARRGRFGLKLRSDSGLLQPARPGGARAGNASP